jgi:hypothetical protein
VIARLQTTAFGTVRSALRASPPRAVALSKPTRLKMQTTTARFMSFRPTPSSRNWFVSTCTPWRKSTTKHRARMSATEAASKTSINSDEIRMSL